MKLISPGVAELLTLNKAGEMPTGNYFGPVGLASFHDHDSDVPQEVKDKLAEIDAALADGSLETGYVPGETE
jgi:basic membrane protein A